MEIVILCLLFSFSLLTNAVISKWSTRKFIGIELSLFKSGFLVLTRTLAALVAGFCIGYAVKVGFLGTGDFKSLQIVGVLMVSLLSFFIYWILLQKVSGKKVQAIEMVKSVAAEAGVLAIGIIVLALILSTIFVLLKVI